MFIWGHIEEIVFSEVLRIPIYMVRDFPHFWLSYGSMNQFSTIIPNRISFRIVMKPSHILPLSLGTLPQAPYHFKSKINLLLNNS
jgi:hypothetical protein